ncbi:peptidase domain-containing ABC transporter [Roseibium sp.]|uniref:peptidase domain-containing ABC transporter n=1 Tax=Roseibium sp. TaxID=1936156 RepID=UPI003297FC1C
MREAIRQFAQLVVLIRPHWTLLIKGMALGFVVGLISMIGPYLTKLLIDEVYPTQDISLMHVLVSGLLALGITTAIMLALQGYYSLYVNARLGNAVSLLFFNHLQHLPLRFFEEHRVGELMSRFQDVRRALEGVMRVFQTLFVQGAYLILVPPFLFILQWKLALVALVSIPFSTLVVALAGRALRRYWKRSSEAYADLSALEVEVLSQIRTLKSMALEHHVFQQASTQAVRAIQMQLRAGGLSQGVGTANGVLRALNVALFTWLGWTFILSGQMTLGGYIAFTAYVGYLYGPVSQFANLYTELQQSAVHLHRVFEYLNYSPEQQPSLAYDAAKPIVYRIKGDISLKNVTFCYNVDEPVLNDITLDIKVGSTIVIVGPSGSGKTSLLRLLTRFESPNRGHILIDGASIEQIPLPDLRRQIAVVWQDFSLLKGTVWDNLTIGLNDVPLEVVHNASRLACVEDLINGLSKGYATPVAEWGASLSGGQRQRLAIARALIRDTPILLFDEVTANVDTQTEVRIINRIIPALREKTVILVTHRVGMAAQADQVCVLQKGSIEGVGTHHELMQSCESYRELQSPSEYTPSRVHPMKRLPGQ